MLLVSTNLCYLILLGEEQQRGRDEHGERWEDKRVSRDATGLFDYDNDNECDYDNEYHGDYGENNDNIMSGR